MDTSNFRKFIETLNVPDLVPLLEAIADELEGRVFREAASRVRDAQADLIAFIRGRNTQVPR